MAAVEDRFRRLLKGALHSGEPLPDLWPEIMARLEKPKSSSKLSVWALACTLLIIVGGAVEVVLLQQKGSQPVAAHSGITGTKGARDAFPLAASFPSTGEGWVLELTRAGATQLSETTDGGHSWQVRLSLSGRVLTGSQLLFLDNEHGFVVTSTIAAGTEGTAGIDLFRTVDGGLHWKETTIPSMSVAAPHIAFADPTRGWILADPATIRQAGVHESTGKELFASSDAGQTWHRVPATWPPGSANYVVAGLSFSSPTVGWLGEVSTVHDPLLLTTHDSGNTWQVIANLTAPSAEPAGSISATYPPRFFDSNHGVFAVQIGQQNMSGMVGLEYVYQTDDGGSHWSNPEQLPESGPVDFLDTTHWFQAGLQGSEGVQRLSWTESSANGLRWQSRAIPIPRGWSTTQLQFITPTLGYAFAVNVTGQSWIDLFSAGGSGNAGAMVSTAHLLRYMLLKTTDHGSSWTVTPLK